MKCLNFEITASLGLSFRVQQIQLLGRDMKGPAHDKLWNQLEAEIHLHRHKTVIRACRGRNDSKKPLPSPVGHVSVKLQNSLDCRHLFVVLPKLNVLISFQEPDMLKKTQGVGPIRKVVLVKDDHEGLGISITVSHSHSCFIPSFLTVPVKRCHP